MTDIIQVLPDAVANQIAAGEVIQRPASVVKELVENAADAGANSITINIKDAGKTLIQVIDNGQGMSETDARLAFERHSTSKIKNADDLFAIKTLGFRGEALASIAAIASVELKTKRDGDDLGVQILIEGSECKQQEPVNCPTGSNFSIKNLFYNVPARRKFLKSNTTEFNHILTELQRIALVQPDISFRLVHNNTDILNLPKSTIRQRIIGLFGKKINENLIDIQSETSIINIHGYIGKPENAKKKYGEQFFFINHRYMKNPYLHRAVMDAYEKILPPDTIPSYFIYMEANPDTIDVNIHPTKTEIKFENQQAIWQILHAAVKQSLGKNNIVPSIDFDQEVDVQIPVAPKDKAIKQPKIEINPNYNPFDTQAAKSKRIPNLDKQNLQNWEKLYEDFEQSPPEDDVKKELEKQEEVKGLESYTPVFSQFKNKYILTAVKSGLMIIHQRRAHERILFEKFMTSLKMQEGISQKSLFPTTIELSAKDHQLILQIKDDLKLLGFDLDEFSGNTVVINGLPADTENLNPEELLDNLLLHYQNSEIDLKTKTRERLAAALSKASSIPANKELSNIEMQTIFDLLFACTIPNYTPDGKKIINIIKTEEIDKLF